MERPPTAQDTFREVHSSVATVTRRLSGAERRVQLLETACDLFALHGYHHISMEDIAAAARVTKPVLYKHFPSKLDLYTSILNQLSDQLISVAQENINLAASPGNTEVHSVDYDLDYELVRAVFLAHVQFVQDVGPAAALLFESEANRGHSLHGRAHHPGPMISYSLATALSKHGSFPVAGLLEPANWVVTMAQGIAVEFLAENDSGQPMNLPDVDSVARFAWNGLRGVVPDRANKH